MHWVLIVGIHMAMDITLGAFQTEKECNKALERFLDTFGRPKEGTIGACLESTSPLLKLGDR